MICERMGRIRHEERHRERMRVCVCVLIIDDNMMQTLSKRSRIVPTKYLRSHWLVLSCERFILFFQMSSSDKIIIMNSAYAIEVQRYVITCLQ